MDEFEEYLDVLQNIEFGIVSVYRRRSDLTDFNVEEALNALIQVYRAQQRGRTISAPKLSSLGQAVFDAVKPICGWRLGQKTLGQDYFRSDSGDPEPISTDDLVACLKRIRKSIKLWSKQGGRQGYLEYIEQFLP